jgi:uncharacterized membrane protein (UPF0127 family)
MLPRRLERLQWRTLDSGARVAEAGTFRARLLGLALLREIPQGHALLIPRCRSVHTFGMRFALDLVFLDAHGDVLRVERAVPPWRVRRGPGAYAVLEARAGEAHLFTGGPRSAG